MNNLKKVTQLMRELNTADPFDIPVVLMEWLDKEQEKVRVETRNEVLDQQKAYHNQIICGLQRDLYTSQQQYTELKKRYAQQYRQTQLAKEVTNELIRYA